MSPTCYLREFRHVVDRTIPVLPFCPAEYPRRRNIVLFWPRLFVVHHEDDRKLPTRILSGLPNSRPERTSNAPPKHIFARNALGFLARDNVSNRLAGFNSRLCQNKRTISHH